MGVYNYTPTHTHIQVYKILMTHLETKVDLKVETVAREYHLPENRGRCWPRISTQVENQA